MGCIQLFLCQQKTHNASMLHEGGSTLVTLPRTITPYRDSVDRTRDHVTYQKLVMW